MHDYFKAEFYCYQCGGSGVLPVLSNYVLSSREISPPDQIRIIVNMLKTTRMGPRTGGSSGNNIGPAMSLSADFDLAKSFANAD